MKSAKIEINDFNISLTLTKGEASAILHILNEYVNHHVSAIADGMISELRKYDLNRTIDGEKKAVLNFTYENKKGETSHRRVEIYSVKLENGDIYIRGLDLVKNEMRTFLYSGMQDIRVNGSHIIVGANHLVGLLFKTNPNIQFGGFPRI